MGGASVWSIWGLVGAGQGTNDSDREGRADSYPIRHLLTLLANLWPRLWIMCFVGAGTYDSDWEGSTDASPNRHLLFFTCCLWVLLLMFFGRWWLTLFTVTYIWEGSTDARGGNLWTGIR